MHSVAVIGAKGFVGSKICQYINSSTKFKLIPVVRGDNILEAINQSDIVVHAANPSRRFYAENNPHEDFIETVEKTTLINQYANKKRLILISSISARTELDTVYGRNRRDCELIVEGPNALIVRLGPMFGAGKSVGALHDLITNNTVYVAAITKYAYVSIDYNAEKIVSFIDDSLLNGYIELGSKEGVSLEKIKKIIGSISKFEGKDDTQIPVHPPSDAPNVMDVVDYVKSLIIEMNNENQNK
jgi:nucleoside-diphosphate-sugar epimerase